MLIVGLFAATGYGTESAEIERLRAENARLQTRVTTLEAELARARRASSALTERAETVVHEAQTNGLRLVHTDPMPVRTDSGVRSRHWLTFRSQPGAAAEAAVEFIIDTASSDGAYRSAEQLQLSIDGSTAAFPVTSYTSHGLGPTRGAGAKRQLDEKVQIALPLTVLDHLAQAHAATAEIGQTTFRFTPEQLAAARAFRARLGP